MILDLIKRFCVLSVFFSCFHGMGYAQLMTDGLTGLLHMPNAEVQRSGTFMLGGNFLDKHNLPNDKWWGYDTYSYYASIAFFDFLEVSYTCTLFKGKNTGFWPQQTWGKFVNQDRHFSGKLRLLKEGQWWQHMPALALGVNDPTTGAGIDYKDMAVDGDGNGFFNRWYIALTKHINTQAGEFGIHAAYLYNRRTDYPLNGPAFGLNFCPAFHKELNFIAEYDAKTINIGATYSLWSDHFNLLFELQQCKYISAGLVYKVNLLGGNQWKKWR
ncbi:YjbH domain-containing protein [Phocaeicola sp.]